MFPQSCSFIFCNEGNVFLHLSHGVISIPDHPRSLQRFLSSSLDIPLHTNFSMIPRPKSIPVISLNVSILSLTESTATHSFDFSLLALKKRLLIKLLYYIDLGGCDMEEFQPGLKFRTRNLSPGLHGKL